MHKFKNHYINCVIIIACITISGCDGGVTNQINISSNNLSNHDESVDIVFNGDDIITENDTVTVDKSTLTINTEGTYSVSGILDNGQIVVNAPDKDVEIILNGVVAHNASGPVIYVIESGNTNIFLAANTENILSDGEDYAKSETDDVPHAVIYSMSDVNIQGGDGATLNIIGSNNDGIVSKDDVEIQNVNIEVTAKDDAVRGKDSVNIADSHVILIAGGDAIKSDNEENAAKGIVSIENSEIEITAGDDGIHAANLVEVFSGDITIHDSLEGIEGRVITVHDGNINLTSRDDGLNITADVVDTKRESVLSDGALNIYGGSVYVNAGGDGLDSNGNATMTGGSLTINGPTDNRNGSIDVNGFFTVNGGTLIAIGSSGMVEVPSDTSSQYALQVNFDTTQGAGTIVSLTNSSGTEIFSYASIKKFQSVVYSSEKLLDGEYYTILLDAKEYAQFDVHNMVTTYDVSL